MAKKKRKREKVYFTLYAAVVVLIVLLIVCGVKLLRLQNEEKRNKNVEETIEILDDVVEPQGNEDEAALQDEMSNAGSDAKEVVTEESESAETVEAAEEVEITEGDPVDKEDILVVIDAGHQKKGNSAEEPNGPGSATMKAKVTGGTSGVASGHMEYELTLEVALKLRDELRTRGYTVKMTRESNDVDISNVQRAVFANEAGADIFVRIHANGAQDPEKNGVMTICQTPSNPYNADHYQESRRLSECILDAFVAATGAKKEYVWETDTMTGINWAMVPSTILEMGYMTNPDEDMRMASDEYQTRMVKGIADGIDLFFAVRQSE